jgi:hypothetical protein
VVSVSIAERELRDEAAKQTGIEWISMKEAGLRWGVHYQTVRGWVSAGLIDGRRFGPKLIRVDAASFERMGTALAWTSLAS